MWLHTNEYIIKNIEFNFCQYYIPYLPIDPAKKPHKSYTLDLFVGEFFFPNHHPDRRQNCETRCWDLSLAGSSGSLSYFTEKLFSCVFQVPQPDDGVLQGRHGVPADVWSHQPAELPQRSKLDECVGCFFLSTMFCLMEEAWNKVKLLAEFFLFYWSSTVPGLMFFGTLAHLICFLLLFPCNHLQASYRQTPTVRIQTSCWWETRRTWPTSGRFRRSRPRSWQINTGGFCFSIFLRLVRVFELEQWSLGY